MNTSATLTGDPRRPPSSTAQRLRNILGGAAGNLIEVFDWFSYITFAIYVSAVMFPGGDQTTQLLRTYLSFGVGFLARPLGAYLMGLYADVAGRRAALTLSISMMCAGSFLLGLTPSHAQIGIAAPVLLTAARVLQGLSIGGEYGASAAYVSEVASRDHRGFWSGVLYMTVIAGQLLAVLLQVLLQALLTEAQMYQWGWRVPFILGGLLSVLVFWIRRRIVESPAFVAVSRKREKGKTRLLFRNHFREVVIVALLTAGGGGAFYFYTTYLKDFLVNSAAGPSGAGFSKDESAVIATVLLLCFLVMQPITGALSDRIGRKPILAVGFGAGAVLAFPVLSGILQATSSVEVILWALPALVALSSYTALSAIVKAELFPTDVRALGISLVHAVTHAVVGASVIPLALGLKAAGRESAMFVVVAVMLAGAFIVAVLMRDTKFNSRIVED